MDFDRTIKCFFTGIYLYVGISLTSTGHRDLSMDGFVYEIGTDGRICV